MSDVGPTPIKGTPPVSEKQSLSQDKSGTPNNPEKQSQAAEKEAIEKPNFDTAVAVSPSVMGLQLHQHVEGEIESVDTEGRPVMVTSHAKFALEPDAGLTPGHRIEIEITQLGKKIEGTLESRDNQPLPIPITVTLTLVHLLHQPDISQDQLLPPEEVQYAYKEGQNVSPQAKETMAFQTDQAALALQKALTDPLSGTKEGLPKHTAIIPEKASEDNVRQTNLSMARLSPNDMQSLVTQTQNISNPMTTTGALETGVTLSGNQIPLGPGNLLSARIITGLSPTLVTAEVFESLKSLGIGTPLIATIVSAQNVQENNEEGGKPHTSQLGDNGQPILKGVFITADQASGRETLETLPQINQQTMPQQAAESETSKTFTKLSNPGQPSSLQTINTHYLKTEVGMLMVSAKGAIAVGTPISIGLTPSSTQSTNIDGSPKQMSGAEATLELSKIATEMQTQKAAENLAKSIVGNQNTPYKNPTGASAASKPGTPETTSSPPQGETRIRSDLPIENELFKAAGAQTPMANIPAAQLRDMPQNWPVMEALQQTIAAAIASTSAASFNPDQTGQLSGRIPGPNQNFSNTALFFMAVLGVKDPKAWLGKSLSKTVETNQKKDIFKALFKDFGRLAQLKTAPLRGEWRPTLIPFQNDQNLSALVILSREEQAQHHDDEGSKNDENDKNNPDHKRFLIAVDLSHLGKVELDGLLRPLRLDFVLRSEKSIPKAIKEDMKNSFEAAMSKSELTGSLSFEPIQKSPVDIQSILNDAQAQIADSEIKV